MSTPDKLAKNQRRTPSQARSRATVEAILEASARILRRKGAGALTTNRIAEVAGVSVGTLYGYFPDKGAIMLALARRMLRQGERAMAEALDAASGVSPARALVRAILRQHQEDKPLRRAVMSVHIGQGHRDEHGLSTQAGVAVIAEQLAARGQAVDPLKLFVATRAVLGVARALVEEPEASAPPVEALEEELMNLIRPYLASGAKTEGVVVETVE
jgi:AcrR family transcriptional regulator